jgi:cyclophilin family peptidyl-prolyl cis-trans isomerase
VSVGRDMQRLRGFALVAAMAVAAHPVYAQQQASSRTTSPTSRPQAPDVRWQAPWAAVLRMADQRKLDTAVARAGLAADAPGPLVANTLFALGQLRDTSAERLLVEALADGKGLRAPDAAFALGLMGRTGLSDTAWRTLEQVATGGAPAAAAAAIRALTSQPARAVRIVRLVLADSLASRDARIAALVTSGLLRDAPPPPPRDIASADTAVSRAAVFAAARLRRAASVRTLLGRVASGAPPSVLALAARGLARSAAGDSLADSARAALVMLSRHADAQVRTEAVQALASHGALAADALRAALGDRHPLARQAAAAGLLAVSRGDTAAVRAAWRADTALHLREAVLQAMSAWTTNAVPAEARGWRSARDWRRRALYARWVLPPETRWALGDAAAFDSVLRDPESRVRRAALEGMAIAGSPPFLPRGAPERLRQATGDASPMVRATAWGVMARTAPDTSDVPLALAAWATAVRDTVDEDARTSIAQFLAAAYARATQAAPGDTAPRRDWRDEWSRAIAALPAPTDAAEAARLLPMFGAVRPTWNVGVTPAPDRTLASYARIVRTIVWPSLAGRAPAATLATTRGVLVATLDGVRAPLTVENLRGLATRGYFDGVVFHRVVPAFVVQGGDPTGTGSGGPGYAIRDELSPTPYERGALGMALSGPDTGGSQWFFALTWQPHLTGGYTVFGHVTRGWATLDALRQYDVIRTLRVR